MFSIAEFLDRAKARALIVSDYQLAKLIGKNQNVITHYRHGRSLPNEETVQQICILSGDDPDLVMAQIQAARAKEGPARVMWSRIAARLAGGATTAILSVCFAISLIAAPASDARANTLDAYKTGEFSMLYIVSSTILSVGGFLRSRLRQLSGFTLLFRSLLAC